MSDQPQQKDRKVLEKAALEAFHRELETQDLAWGLADHALLPAIQAAVSALSEEGDDQGEGQRVQELEAVMQGATAWRDREAMARAEAAGWDPLFHYRKETSQGGDANGTRNEQRLGSDVAGAALEESGAATLPSPSQEDGRFDFSDLDALQAAAADIDNLYEAGPKEWSELLLQQKNPDSGLSEEDRERLIQLADLIGGVHADGPLVDSRLHEDDARFLRNLADQSEQSATEEGLREKVEAELEHQRAIYLTADQESMHLGAAGNLEGEKETKLIATIAGNTIRHLEAALAATTQPSVQPPTSDPSVDVEEGSTDG